MKKNPCRYCNLALDNKGRKTPNWKHECVVCEYNKQHRMYLESQRKFIEGEQITSIDELLKQEWVMWFHTTKHIEVIKHNQLCTVLKWLDIGALKYAVRKESEEN